LREKRKKIWIDKFQTKLSLRLAFHFALYQIAVLILMIIERRLTLNMEAMGGHAGTSLLIIQAATAAYLGCLFIYDTIKFSHRVVGPLHNFRKAIQAITAGEEIDLVALRKTDLLQEMKDDFNKMVKVLEERGAVTLKKSPEKEHELQAFGSEV
jgi:nitrate/nitrite-specific signal transduction histidine kinase